MRLVSVLSDDALAMEHRLLRLLGQIEDFLRNNTPPAAILFCEMSKESHPSNSESSESVASQSAWQLLLRNAGWLRAVVFARLRNTEAIDDVMQNVALAVAQARELPPQAELPRWLHRVAVRQALLHRRRTGRRRRLVKQYAEARRLDNPDGFADPLSWLLSTEKNELLREALEQMPSREVEILLLKYGENWSYGQIARHLGLSVSAVQGRLHRARQRLRQLLSSLADTRSKEDLTSKP